MKGFGVMNFIMSIPPEKQLDEDYRNKKLGEMREGKRKIIMSMNMN